MAPNIALVYNSQGGNNVAGYGWGISGLSSITVRNSTLYYDGAAESDSYSSMTPKYSLDGVPIVESEMGITGYPYSTARGNIQIQLCRNARNGRVVAFNALYPDGSIAVFGYPDGSSPHTSYPITSLTDINGNTISFTYNYVCNTYYVTSISYGNNASIDFGYSERNDTCAYKYASSRVYTDYLRKLLTTITSRDGNNVICQYSLTHEELDGVNLLKEVHCTSGSSELPPLLFTYGIDSESGGVTPTFEQVDINFFYTYYDSPLQSHRGQLIPGRTNNCVITLPDRRTYAKVDSTWRLQNLRWFFKYGSEYGASQYILCNFLGEESNVQKSITTEAGFQLIEAVDVNGDGVDELVKINSWASATDVTTYKITIYSFDSNADYTSSSFNVTVNDGTHNVVYNNPAQSYYRFGNFRGDGTMMLLIMTKKSSLFALVDLNAHSKLSETSLFTIDDEDEDNLILSADFENDGKTDLCHITDSGMTVYSLANTSFSQRTTYSGVSKSQLYVEPNFLENNVPWQTKAKIYIIDINGDGYLDIAAAPESGFNVNGHTVYSTVWNIARFNGVQFSTETTLLNGRTPQAKIVFLDIDKDGLPDLLHLNDPYLLYFHNNNGQFTLTSYSYTELGAYQASDLVPADYSLFGTKASALVVAGPFITEYEFGIDHSVRRRIDTMTDSFGILHSNTYRDLSGNSGVYLTDTTRTYSAIDGFSRRILPLNVLYNSTVFNGQQKIGSEFYTYWDAVYNHKGLGFCGFGKIAVRDSVNVAFTTTVLNPEKFGVTEEVTTSKSYNGPAISTVVNTYDNNSTTYGKLNPRLTGSVATDALTGIVTTTTCSYGDYDFPSTVITARRIGNGAAQTDTLRRVYNHSITASKFVLGAVTEESTIQERNGVASMSWKEKTVTTYDICYRPLTRKKYVGNYGAGGEVPFIPLGNRGLNDSIPVIHPPDVFTYDANNLVSETHWQYDSHGNVISETTAPYGASEFIGNTYTYDSDGRYILTDTDAIGHTTTYSGYNKFGKPSTVTDYRGRVTTCTYDSWGNVASVSYPDNSVEQTTVAWGGTGLYTVTSTATGQPESVIHYDALGREIRRGVKRFNGQWQWVDREYNANGLLKRVSLPYRGQYIFWNKYFYDDYNRIDSLKYASGKWSTWSYNGTSVTTLKDGITSTQTTDASGNVVSVTDAGGTITYTLRDDGQPSSITAPGNVSTTFNYDAYGRRTQIVDPSAGTQTDSYLWNSDGSSKFTHTNSNGTVKTYRDKYGRITLIERPGEYNTAYTYDTYGLLSAESSTNGTGKEYTYDSYDRVIYSKESVPDNKWLEKEYTYSPGGVLSSIKYTSQAGYITTETYSYSNGHNTGITLPGGGVVWSLTTENELGQPTKITTGTINRQYWYTFYGLPSSRTMNEGNLQYLTYEFDPLTGNLLEREDYLNEVLESFGYDNLNRLTSIGNRQITYASNGNILSMDGVGTMAYMAAVHPYQITSLTPASSGLVQGRQQNVSYTSYNRPSLLTEGGRSATFTYNGDAERVKMNVADNSGNVLTRYYIGGRYECDLTTSGTKERLYLGGDAYSAPMVYQRENNGSWTLYNIGRDYLGSVTHIATADGTLVAEYSYDPWGRLRDPATLQIYVAGSEPELFLGRGFTGHEHLTWFGLINMNARLYDPLLGRFLSPDPYIQVPDFTQNFNRYSYALNNPLKYSDESGDVFFPTYRITSNGIRIGLSNGFWGFGFAFSVEQKELWVGGYLEAGYRVENGLSSLAATVDVQCLYGINSEDVKTSLSANLAAKYGIVSASASVSYTFMNDDIKHGIWMVGINASLSPVGKYFGPSIGYVWKYDCKTGKSSHILSAGVSFAPPNTDSSELYSANNSFSASVGYTLRELNEGEHWTNLLSLNVSFDSTIKKTKNNNSVINGLSLYGWERKPMKPSKKIPFMSLNNSLTLYSLYLLFGEWWSQEDEGSKEGEEKKDSFKP